MNNTIQGLIAHCKQAVLNNVQYVYGAKMQILTYEQIKALQNIYGSSYIWNSDMKKAGKLCCDCSGLISSYTGITRSSSNYKATALEVVNLTTLKADWNKYVGYGLWMNGHIGVVSDKEGYYYAMDGSVRNMVHYPISKQGWNCAIKLADIDYTSYKEVDDMTSDEVKKICNDMIYEHVTSKKEAVYNTLSDVPEWGQTTVKKLIEKGFLQGSDTGLDLGYTLLRLLVINDRAGLYD